MRILLALILGSLPLSARAFEVSAQPAPATLTVPALPMAAAMPLPQGASAILVSAAAPVAKTLGTATAAISPRLEAMTKQGSGAESSASDGEQVVRLLQGADASDRPASATEISVPSGSSVGLSPAGKAAGPALFAAVPLVVAHAMPATAAAIDIHPWWILGVSSALLLFFAWGAIITRLSLLKYRKLPGYVGASAGGTVYDEFANGHWVKNPTLFFKDKASADAARPLVPTGIAVMVDYPPADPTSTDFSWG